ncbi:MAG TPA: hypothetical protein VG435_12675 [Acidimicrobiales bacterium]|nr:hypothetical protein [Acidimicrobiales bacterium]
MDRWEPVRGIKFEASFDATLAALKLDTPRFDEVWLGVEQVLACAGAELLDEVYPDRGDQMRFISTDAYPGIPSLQIVAVCPCTCDEAEHAHVYGARQTPINKVDDSS